FNNAERFNAKVEYRVKQWDVALHGQLVKLAETNPTLWIGDLNVAPTDLDVSGSADDMAGKAGTTAEERESHNKFCTDNKFVDVWRAQHPTDKQMTQSNHKSSMRLDHVISSASAIPHCVHAWMVRRTPTSLNHSSDHVPVGVTYV